MNAKTYRLCQGIIVGFYCVNLVAPWVPMRLAIASLFPWSGLLVLGIHVVQLAMYINLRRRRGADIPGSDVSGILLYGMLHLRARAEPRSTIYL